MRVLKLVAVVLAIVVAVAILMRVPFGGRAVVSAGGRGGAEGQGSTQAGPAGVTAARHLLEVRRVLAEGDRGTAVEESADPGRPGGRIRLSREVLADETRVTYASVRENSVGMTKHTSAVEIWLAPDDARHLLDLKKQVGEEVFQTAVLLDGKVVDSKTWELTLQDNGETIAPYGIVYVYYDRQNLAEVEALAARFNAIAHQRPGAVVRGQVLDRPGGKGVAGVTASIILGGETRTAQDAVTDAEGKYEFKNVPAFDGRSYYLRVGKDEAWVWSQTASMGVGRGNIGETITAEPLYTGLVTVSGRVFDKDTHEAMGGTMVRIRVEKVAGGSVKTDSQGRYRFRIMPQTVQITAEGTRDRYMTSDARSVTVAEGKDMENVDIELASAPAFDVEVTDAAGKPVANMPIAAYISHFLEKRRPGEDSMVGSRTVLTPSLVSDARGHARGYLNALGQQSDLDFKKPFEVRLFTRTEDGKIGGYLAADMIASETQKQPLQLRVAETASVEFSVADAAGHLDANAKLRSEMWVGNTVGIGRHWPQLTMDFANLGGGRYRTAGLIPGLQYVIGVYTFPGQEGGLTIQAQAGEQITGRSIRVPPSETYVRTGVVTAQPAWDELAKLVGERLDAPAVKEFVAKQQLGPPKLQGEGHFYRYYSQPYSLAYREGKIDALNMRVYRSDSEYQKSMPLYTGSLPGGLKGGESRQQVIERLGKPSSQDGKAFEYDQQRLVLTFADNQDALQVVSLTATPRPIFVRGPEKYFDTQDRQESVFGDKMPIQVTAAQTLLLFDDSPSHLRADWERRLPEKPRDVFRTSLELAVDSAPQLTNAVPPASRELFARVMLFSDKTLEIRVLRPLGSLAPMSYYQTEATVVAPRSAELDKLFDMGALEKKFAASYRGIQQGDSRDKVIKTLGEPEKLEGPYLLETFYYEQGRVKIAIWLSALPNGRAEPQVHSVSVEAVPATRGGVVSTQPAVTVQQLQVKNVSAQDMARLINAMFAPSGTSLGRGPSGKKFYADYDERTHTVMVNGDPKDVEAAVKMIRMVDEATASAPGPNSVLFIVHLKNVKAQELALVLNARHAFASTVPVNGATAPVKLGGGTRFVAEPDGKSILVSCEKELEEQIREEIVRLDVVGGEPE